MNAATLFALLWAGILLGTSFLATPAKFLAPSLSLAEALDVGKATFAVLGWVEAVLFCLLFLSLWAVKRAVTQSKPAVVVFIFFSLLLAVQHFLLLPELDMRTTLVIQGTQLEPSNLHHFYIAIESLKVCLLIALAIKVNTIEQSKPKVIEES